MCLTMQLKTDGNYYFKFILFNIYFWKKTMFKLDYNEHL